ncbi:hypothetical protein [Aurantibacillus circumpalustris]|uniref:hypothetical protein n=1 Tax=Aurantibacillus circumpalustris TaxID=3036359 RepID=UPI00295AD46E|nr:hypothetical protein [Aurantibacillus circumpalustris]
MKHLLFVLCMLMFITLQAQNPSCEIIHSERKSAGNYQIETTTSAYHIDVTIYDKKNKALSASELTDYAGFYYPDGSYLKKRFIRIPGTNTFSVKIPYPGFRVYTITLIVNGEIISAEFENVRILKMQSAHDQGQ